MVLGAGGDAMNYSRRRFTKAEVYRLLEADVLHGERFQLIGGDLYTDPPMNNYQGCCIDILRECLQTAFGSEYWVRTRCTLDLADDFVPDPHVAVIPGGLRSWFGRKDNPTSALLVIEVPGPDLSFVRDVKMRHYATAGIEDLWLVSVEEQTLDVYRVPDRSPSSGETSGYATRVTYRPGDRISPLAAPGAVVQVADLKP